MSPTTGIHERHDLGASWMVGSGGANASRISGCEGRNGAILLTWRRSQGRAPMKDGPKSQISAKPCTGADTRDPAAEFPSLPPMPSDLLIVEKRNPVDP